MLGVLVRLLREGVFPHAMLGLFHALGRRSRCGTQPAVGTCQSVEVHI